MSVEITIDPEFQSLIHPLAADELELLTKQILEHGCLQPLCVWKTEDDRRILLDGHNRYAISTKHQRGYQTVNVRLASREHAKLWILEHQMGRRNLTDGQRAGMVNRIREQRSAILTAERSAKANAAKADPTLSAKTTDKETKRDTRAEVAKEFNVPESQLRKMDALKKTNPKLHEAVCTGKVKLRDAKPTPKPTKKSLRERYSEPDFFARISRMLEGTLRNHPLLDELLALKKSDWTPEAEEGFRQIITLLGEVSDRADEYATALNKILKSYGKAKAA